MALCICSCPNNADGERNKSAGLRKLWRDWEMGYSADSRQYLEECWPISCQPGDLGNCEIDGVFKTGDSTSSAIYQELRSSRNRYLIQYV